MQHFLQPPQPPPRGFVERSDARFLPASRRPCLHALAQYQAGADRRYLKRLPSQNAGSRAALTGTLDIPAVKGAAIRPCRGRIDPVAHMSRAMRRHGRDGVVLWPAHTAKPADLVMANPIPRGRRCASPAGGCPPESRHAGHPVSGRFALLKLPPGRFESAFPRGLTSRRWRRLCVDASRGEVWHGLRRRSRIVRLGRGPRAALVRDVPCSGRSDRHRAR